MKKLVKQIGFILLIVMFLNMPTVAQCNTKVFIKGKPLDITTIMDNNRTLVPIRAISEELGFKVEYKKESKIVNITKDDKIIGLTLGSIRAKINDKEIKLDVKTFIKDNKTFVLLRFISEALGEEVVWDGNNQIVMIGHFTGETKTEDTFLYFNDQHGYTLSFPNSWKEEAIINTKDGDLYVYDKRSVERFKEDGYDNCDPAFEIRCSDYPVISTVPYDENRLLNYEDGKYIEVIFVNDFQYYPETKDSYFKIYNKGKEVLGLFRMIDEDTTFVEDNKDNYKK